MAKETTKKKETASKTESLVKREYTEEEKASITKYQELAKRKPVKFKEVKGDSGKVNIDFEYPDGQLCQDKLSEALGTADPDLQGHFLEQMAETFKGTVSSEGQDNKAIITATNRAMAILNGIQPQNEIEAMLVVQMIGVHNMAMAALGRGILKDQTFAGRQANADQATKMLRTFAVQMEALQKYRTGGQQKTIVENVNVNEGGQAIVGTVNQSVEKKTQENSV
jgi:hypothetical protein